MCVSDVEHLAHLFDLILLCTLMLGGCFHVLQVSLVYESPGGNQVDGLPPVAHLTGVLVNFRDM